MRRGEIWLVALSGDYGKVRPCAIIQSNAFSETGSIVVCPLTSDTQDIPMLRLTVDAGEETGLTNTSKIMVDKITAVRKDRLKKQIGHLGEDHLLALDRMLAVFLGMAG